MSLLSRSVRVPRHGFAAVGPRKILCVLYALRIAGIIPAFAETQIAPGDACVMQQFQNALDKVKQDEKQVYDDLSNRLGVTWIISLTTGGKWEDYAWAKTRVCNTAANYVELSQGKRFPDDNVCVDLTAALVHELMHCYHDVNGAYSEPTKLELKRNNGILPKEVDATNYENGYRDRHGLCRRLYYESKPLPGVVQNPACPDPAKQMCTSTLQQCFGCCWIYGKKSTACTQDQVTKSACYLQDVANKVSTNWTNTPCSQTWPGVPPC
jgi:hypothetical protein